MEKRRRTGGGEDKRRSFGKGGEEGERRHYTYIK